MKELTKQIAYLVLIVMFISILILTILSYVFYNSQNPPSLLNFFIKYHIFFMLLVGILGVIFGGVSQILTSKKIESNQVKIEKMICLFMKNFNSTEKKIIEYLKINKGVSTQYELTKLEGVTKLQISRTIIGLEKKNFIIKKKIGKINKIYLNKELYLLLDKK